MNAQLIVEANDDNFIDFRFDPAFNHNTLPGADCRQHACSGEGGHQFAPLAPPECCDGFEFSRRQDFQRAGLVRHF